MLEGTSGEMPRLDAHLASLLMESKHLKGELGLQFQAYTESEQMRGRAPLGRVLLSMIAKRFFLDQNRGANLTQQSLLEIEVTNFTHEGLRSFVDRVEYVLNSIPPELQPSEMTRYTWLYSRMRKVRAMQRHVDKIRDSRAGSHCRTWEWLFNKLKICINEMREDQNEEAVRSSLQSKTREKNKLLDKPKPKAAAAVSCEHDAPGAESKGLPIPKAKAKPKPQPKAKGKGEGSEKDKKGKGKGKSQGEEAKPNPKAKPDSAKPEDSSRVECLFWGKGTCTRGDACPFYHDPAKAKAAAKPKPAPSKSSGPSSSTAKAAVATIAAVGGVTTSSACPASPCRVASSMGKSFIGRIMQFLASCVTMFTGVKDTNPLQVYAEHASLQAMPAVVSHEQSVALSARSADKFAFEWIADSGAGRDLASVRALTDQGVPQHLVQKQMQSTSPIKFETGNGTVVSDSCIDVPGSLFGKANFQIMDDCPLVRSLGKLVEQGYPFIWCPGELPYFGRNAESVQVAADASTIIVANRVEDGVPIFSEEFHMSSAYALAGASSEGVEPAPPPAEVPRALEAVREEGGSSDADSEGEMPIDRMRRLVAEANSLEHKLCHFPKNASCPICQRSRMYRKRVRRFRHDPLADRGALDPVTTFGERIATDFVIVQKLSTGKEHAVQVIRDEYSGWLRAFPLAKRDTSTVVGNILAFLGPSYEQPSIMVKSDQAVETKAACKQLGCAFEGTLENRFPHNATLERDIRTLQEIARACHLQAGFDVVPGLWVHSIDYAATILSARQKAAGKDQTRHMLAVGVEFSGRKLLLGQLVHYYVDPSQRGKFDPSSKPGLFAGWRYDSGPKSHKGIYLVLDYGKVKDRGAGYANAISVPAEELFVEEKEPMLPLKRAADLALANFGDVALEDIAPLDIPFSDAAVENKTKRNEYITLERIIRFGATDGCRACRFEATYSKHTPVCRARFNGLLRAERIASGKEEGAKTPVPMPETPATMPVPPTPVVELPEVDKEFAGVPSEELPFSAGIPPGHAAIGKVLELDEVFVETCRMRNRYRRLHRLPGDNVLFEFACSNNSVLGQVAESINVDCIRLSRDMLDLTDPDHLSQALGQVDAMAGADTWVSIVCTHHSPLQHLNKHIHGRSFQRKLKQRQKEAIVLLRSAEVFMDKVLSHGGRVAFELPAENELWQDPQWLEFEKSHCMKRVYFHGCAFNLRGKKGELIKKPWAVSTTDLRLIQFLDQCKCDGKHEHEPAMGGNAAHTAYYTPEMASIILEALYPNKYYCSIPCVVTGSALVTLNLTRSQWLNDEQGVQAVQNEAGGLRQNETWDDDTVDTLHNWKIWARNNNIKIHVADLLTLCGIKHYELEPAKWKYKGRIVYRGDRIRDSEGNIILFQETATSPTAIIALQIALWFGMLAEHMVTCSDAIQAFLQSRLDEDDFTLVIIPVELWLPDWKNRFGEDARLAVRLRKSLYGHPMAGRWWQDHLTSCLVSLGGIEMQEHPSNFLFRWNPSKHGGDVDHEYVLLLNVYVDDLTLSGHRSCHGSFWSALSSKVKMEPFQEIDSKGLLILGRRHFIEKGPSQTKITFDMRTYVDQVVGSYCELTGTKQQSLKKVSTPSYPENTMTDQELSQTGELSGVASRILMRALWLSRLARPDISFIVGRLTTRVTQWTKFEDRQLYRCICYLHHSRDKVLVGEIDHAHEHEASIEVYTDADFAGCPHSAKSTSGIMIAIKTGGATYPLHWSSRKQSSVARSTPEAELIAMSTAMFTEVFNVQTMLEHLMQRPVPVNYRQDNQAVVQILETGYSAKLRHAPRVHRVNVSSVHEVLQDEHMHAVWYTQTSEQIANGLTKVITPAEWPAMLKQLCICDFAVGSAT